MDHSSGHTIVPAWIVVVIIAREFAVTSLRSFAAAEHLVIPAGFSGKVKTIVQIVSIALLIIYNQLGEFRHLAPVSLWVALAVTVYSGVEYFVRFGKLFLRGGSPPPASAQSRIRGSVRLPGVTRRYSPSSISAQRGGQSKRSGSTDMPIPGLM